jgi:hypothetical protein
VVEVLVVEAEVVEVEVGRTFNVVLPLIYRA